MDFVGKSAQSEVSLNAYDYKVTDLIEIVDQQATNDSDVIHQNVLYYLRKYKSQPQYHKFFMDMYSIFLSNNVIQNDQQVLKDEHTEVVKDDLPVNQGQIKLRFRNDPKKRIEGDKKTEQLFDISEYSLSELAAAMNYDLDERPDIQHLVKEKTMFLKRFVPKEKDDAEELDNKQKMRDFFNSAYDMLIAYFYPKYQGLNKLMQMVPSNLEQEPNSLAPPNIRQENDGIARHHEFMKPIPISSQMVKPQMQQFNMVEQKMSSMNLQKKQRKVIINVDTRFRKTYFNKATGDVTSTSDMFFSLDERIKNARKVTLSSFEFPNSAYAVSSAFKSNVFYVQVTKNNYQVYENGDDFLPAGSLPAAVQVTQATLNSWGLPRRADIQHYIDYKGAHHQVTGGRIGTYRVEMMSGNYSKDTLVAAVNQALRNNDISSGLSAIMVDFNIAYNKLVLRTVDINDETTAKNTKDIRRRGMNVSYDGRTYRGQNDTGGLLSISNEDFSFNLFFDVFEQLDASGNFDLLKPTPNRPLFFNVGWIFGFRKNRYIYEDDYVKESVDTALEGDEEGALSFRTKTNFFQGYNAEAPYDINNMRYFYVCLTDYVASSTSNYIQGIRNDYNFVQSMYGVPSDVIARIVNNGPKLHYTFFDQSDFIMKSRHYDVPVTLQNFRMYIVDEYGRNMDLNGMDWSAALEILTDVD